MKTEIERLDQSRYTLTLWRTVAWSLGTGAFLGLLLFSAQPWRTLFMVAALGGVVLYLVFTGLLIRVKSRIAKDPTLKEALFNEMHRAYLSKAYTWGYWVLIFLLCAGLFSQALVSGKLELFFLIALYFGALTPAISYLILNRK